MLQTPATEKRVAGSSLLGIFEPANVKIEDVIAYGSRVVASALARRRDWMMESGVLRSWSGAEVGNSTTREPHQKIAL